MPFTEEYKRFRFDEIQCLSVVRTSRVGKGISYLGGFLFASMLVALILGVNTGDKFTVGVAISVSFFAIAGLGCLALLLRHLILGPSCVCDIQTSLSRERLRSLNRLHQANQAIAQIERLVRDAQEKIAEGQPGTGGQSGITQRAESRMADAFRVPALVLPSSLVFIALGILTLTGLHIESIPLAGIVMISILAASFLIIMSLVGAVRNTTPPQVKAALWTQLGLLFVLIGAGAIYFLAAATVSPEYTIGILGPLEAFSAIATEGGMIFYILFLVLGLGMFATGLAGAVQSLKWKKRLAHIEERNAESMPVEEESDG